LILEPETPLQTTFGQIGRGVTASGIQRIRDQVLDASYRKENGDLGRFNTSRDLLGQVEAIFGEPSGTGLSSGIDQLFSAFGDLANDPTSKTARMLVSQSGTALAQSFQDIDRRLTDAGNDVTARMRGAVADVNQLVSQIADLNTRIQAGTAGNREAPDLKDQRDKLVDQLSGTVGVRVLQRPDGTIGVLAGDALLVDGGGFSTLEVRDNGGGKLSVGMTGTTGAINLQGGSLAALAELSVSTIPGIRTRLDTLVKGIVTEVNALHRTGTGLTGGTGIDFFNPTGLTAASMALSQPVQLSSDNIAAGKSGAAGDNSNALALSALRSTGVASFNGATIGEAFQGLVSELGVTVRDVTSRQTAQEIVVSHADTLRQSISGVSIDEELTALIGQQNAYKAAARLVTTADDMVQAVIAMVR
jgi:flagellar hook-associated protein 1 FlgK